MTKKKKGPQQSSFKYGNTNWNDAVDKMSRRIKKGGGGSNVSQKPARRVNAQ
jgi:hypothetical protein